MCFRSALIQFMSGTSSAIFVRSVVVIQLFICAKSTGLSSSLKHFFSDTVINRWMKKLYWNNEAFKSSTFFDHIKTHYYWSHVTVCVSLLHSTYYLMAEHRYVQINPTRVVPVGPIPDVEPL